MRKTKELDEIKLSGFHKNAAGCRALANSVVQAVTGAALDEDAAFQWITRVMKDDVTFEELGNAGIEHH